uniref:Uncharacterized protein LOC102809082 n=1 Tax=Saccoglossus kowalevskii TaxID=10224 RepID=A0ABM0M4R0_SACKO|nr:PREDICTED: uncharacterized protein LOC102809082 [Saccoglossus kowalevskii]
MSSALFSPLSKGYGSWEDGDLEAHDETVLPKPILPNLLEGEDASFKDKTLNIPLRTKTAQSIITELYKTKITAPPPEETYTVYSRPRTAATPRSTFSYSTPRTAQSVRTKSAAPSLITQSEHTTRSDGEIVLPKTFLTRRGALLLFSAPDELKFSKEQKCYLSGQQIGPPIRILDDGVPLRTVNKLTSSVLQYGRDWGPGSDLESYSSHYDKTFLKFLKNVDDEEAMDLHAQPGGDMSFYLRDLQFRTRSSMGFRPTSGRSVTSELQRAELTEELRKIDTTDERNAYRISADVSRLRNRTLCNHLVHQLQWT